MIRRFEVDIMNLMIPANEFQIYLFPSITLVNRFNKWFITLMFWKRGFRLNYIKKNYWQK